MPEPESYLVVLEMPEGQSTIRCGRDEYVWTAAARQGIRLPSVCLQGRCLTCTGRLLSGKVDQSRADTFPEDEASGFVVLCSAKPLTDLRILTHQQQAIREHRVSLGLPVPY